MGAQDNIKFPTLEVRNPNELSRGPVQEKLFAKGPVYKQSTADIEEKIREINKAVEAKIEEQEEVIDTLTDLAAIEVVAEEMAEAALIADELEDVEVEILVDPEEEEEDITGLVDMKVIDIEKSVAEAVAEEIAEEIEEELEEEIVEEVKEEAEELVEEEVLEEMVKEAVIDLAEAEAVEDNIVESEVTTVEPSEEEVDFGDITEVAV